MSTENLPKTMWWFVKDGRLFGTAQEDHAWNYYKDDEYENFGTSDGSTYKKIHDKNKSRLKEVNKKCKKLAEQIDRFEEKKDELIYDKLLDEEHEKVQRVEERIEEKQQELGEAQQKRNEIEKGFKKKAQKAEATKAKKNGFQPPKNQDVKTPRGDREEIMNRINP